MESPNVERFERMTGVGQIGRFGSNFRSQGQFLGFGWFWAVLGFWSFGDPRNPQN